MKKILRIIVWIHIITDPKLMTKQTKEKLKHIAGRIFKKKMKVNGKAFRTIWF